MANGPSLCRLMSESEPGSVVTCGLCVPTISNPIDVARAGSIDSSRDDDAILSTKRYPLPELIVPSERSADYLAR